MKIRYNDNAATVLGSAADVGHTVLIVSSATLFPVLSNGDWMYVTVEEEVVKVTATSGNVFTCEPINEAHGVGASVENRITASVLDQSQDADVFTNPGDRPENGSMRHGEIFANLTDRQVGFGDVSGNPVDILALRFHSSSAGYVVGDLVVYGNEIWKATLTHTGAWNENNWEQISGGGGLAWELSPTGDVTAEAGAGYFVYTNSGSRNINLPVGVVGAIVSISDISGNCDVNNITIISNGSENIMGLVENFIMDKAGSTIHFTYADATTGWKITGGSW